MDYSVLLCDYKRINLDFKVKFLPPLFEEIFMPIQISHEKIILFTKKNKLF
jgi:hypothetical protein